MFNGSRKTHQAVQLAPSSLKSIYPDLYHLFHGIMTIRLVQQRQFCSLRVQWIREAFRTKCSTIVAWGCRGDTWKTGSECIAQRGDQYGIGPRMHKLLTCQQFAVHTVRARAVRRPFASRSGAFRCTQWRPHHDPICRIVWLHLVPLVPSGLSVLLTTWSMPL